MKHAAYIRVLAVTVLLVPGAARADFPLPAIPEGTRVRVTSRSLGLAGDEGTVALAGSRGLIVDFAGLHRTPVPLPEVDHLEICRYQGRATLQGATAGFGLGILAGAYISVSNDVFRPDYDSRMLGTMLVSAGVGAVVGALVGSTITYESWRPIIWYENDPDWGLRPGVGFTSVVPAGD